MYICKMCMQIHYIVTVDHLCLLALLLLLVVLLLFAAYVALLLF